MSHSNSNPFDVLEQKLHNIEVMLMDITFENPQSDSVYLTAKPAADFLSTTPNAIRVMVCKNQIPHIKKQGKLFFKKSELIDWLESGRVEQMPIIPEDALLVNRKGNNVL